MNITQEIETLVTEYDKPPCEINNGQCEDFMMTIVDRMGGYSLDLTDGTPSEVESELPGHYWIEYKGRYYDAECPQGVDNWQDLPIFRRFYNSEGINPSNNKGGSYEHQQSYRNPYHS